MTTPTNNSDIRWQQRQQNFERALEKLEQACQRLELNELEAQGLIKAFEYTYELAWNMLRDYLLFQGNSGLHGSQDSLLDVAMFECTHSLRSADSSAFWQH